MASQGNFLSDILQRVRADAHARVDEGFVQGFNEAANVCVNAVSARFDAVMKRIAPGSSLSEAEQLLLAELNTLKAEMEADLRAFWQEADHD